jgi:hypothetical protein
MLPFNPESTSELLRARHIMLVAIESARFGEWRPSGEMLRCREVSAQLRVERVLKGQLELPASGVVESTFEMCENHGPRFVAVPRIWSGYEIRPGAHFVVFSLAGPTNPVDVLGEPSAFRVEPAENAIGEIEALLGVATPEKSLPLVVEELAHRRRSFTHLFARYVAWRLRELLYSDPSGFSVVLDEAENLETSHIFSRIVTIEAYDDLMMLDPAPPVFIARLMLGSLRLLASGRAADFGSRILATYIPNLLGIEGGLERKTATAVFESAPEQRQELARILRGLADLPGRDTLLTWLSS